MNVGVVGTGTLGPSIAQVFAQCEQVEVVYLCKGRVTSQRNGMDAIEKGLQKQIIKGKMTHDQVSKILNKIVVGPKAILHDADLVIEAVSENLDVKQKVFAELDGVCKSGCVFATNTSSLPIKSVGEGVSRPVIGMHFFNPAQVMKLVEVITTDQTPRTMADWLMDVARMIGKTPVLVREAPGFVVNRILIPMINEAIGIYARGGCCGGGYRYCYEAWCQSSDGAVGIGRFNRAGCGACHYGGYVKGNWRCEVPAGSSFETDGPGRKTGPEERRRIL